MELLINDQVKDHGEDEDLRFDRENESTTGGAAENRPDKEADVKTNVLPDGIPPLSEEEKVPKLKEEELKK